MKKAILSAILVLTLLAGPVMAQTVIKAFVPAGPNRPDAKMMAAMCAKIEELSKGELKVDVYYAGGMGFPVKDLMRHLKKNTVQLSAILPAYYPREIPALAAMFPDGVALDEEDFKRFVPALKEEIEKGLQKKPWEFEIVGYFQTFFFDHGVYSSEPINTLNELKTKKVRVWTKHQLIAFKDLGVSAQIIPKEDLFVALQTGVVDCAIYLGEVAPMAGLQEVAKYEKRFFPWINTPIPYVMGKKAWNSLSPSQQKAVKEACEWSYNQSIKAAYGLRAAVEKSRQARVEKGFVDNGEFSKADRAQLVKAFRDAWKVMTEKTGDDGVRIYNKLSALVKDVE